MVIIQELMLCKYRAVFKYFYKKSYRKDINYVRDILCKKKLQATEKRLPLFAIEFSHEINYPDWVDKLIDDLKQDPTNYKRIKVFYDEKRGFLVIDGNHRLKAMRKVFPFTKHVDVLELSYKN